MHPDDIEGEEAGDERVDADEEIEFTPFNMKEELEDGHFDHMGHYHFKKGDERHLDNWLDDVDWVKIKKNEDYKKKYYTAEGEYISSSDEDDEVALNLVKKFDPLASFKQILTYMRPKESINQTLQRLNKSKLKISTAERIKMKKQGIVDEASETITKITGLVNEILTKTGNMNVYELTYEQIQLKLKDLGDKAEAGSSKEPELDMYADDFDEKEKQIKDSSGKSVTFAKPEEKTDEEPALMWEYKMTQNEDDEIQGPFTTEQMSKKADNGDFKVFVRKVGEERFYSSARIDFELYL